MEKSIIIPPSLTPVTVKSVVSDPVLQTDGKSVTVVPQSHEVTYTGFTGPTVPPVDPVPTTPGIPASARIVFASDFTNGFSGFQTVDGQYAQIGAGKIVNDPLNASNKVFNSIVPAKAPRISSGYRAELTLGDTPQVGEMYYSFRVMFLKSPGTDQGHFFQIHPANDTGSAAFALYFNGGNISIIRSLTKGNNIYETPTKKYELNKWYDILIHAKWASNATGLLEVSINGEKFFAKTSIQTMPGEGGYLKFGENMWSGRTGETPDVGMSVLLDDLKIARA